MKKYLLCLVLMLVLLAACKLSAAADPLCSMLPHNIYTQPEYDYYTDSRAGVLEFNSPDYAKDSGKKAAEKLYKELLKKNKASGLVFIPQSQLPAGQSYLIQLMKSKKLDLLITGEVKEICAGGNYQHSRVCEEIKIFEPANDGLRSLWYARSCETSDYLKSRDLIFFRTPGKPSAPADLLMEKIALQFANMLTQQPCIKNDSETKSYKHSR
jgi:hypothetical protein